MGRKADFCCPCFSFKEGLFALLAKSTEALLQSWLRWACAPGGGALDMGFAHVPGFRSRGVATSSTS